MSPEDGKAVVIFSMVQGATPQEASTKFTTDNTVTVSETKNITVNGMNAVRTTGVIPQGEDKIAIESHFIQKGTSVFAFHGISAPADNAAYTGAFSTVATGFNTVTDANLKDVSPAHIEVRSVDRNKLLSKVFSDFGVPESRLDELAVINGMELYDMIQAGTRIKIIT